MIGSLVMNFGYQTATTLTELSKEGFFHHVQGLVDTINPDAIVMEAGPVWQPNLARKLSVVKRRFVYRY